MGGGFTRKGRPFRRYQDIEKDIPPRVRKEPKSGDNPLKRPYPPHARDIDILDQLLQDVPKEHPTDIPNKDWRTATRPHGLLYFHVLDIQNIKLSKKDFIPGAVVNVYLEYECQGTIKCSYPVCCHMSKKIRIDHYTHFSAEVSEVRLDEENDFVVHVYAFQNPEKHILIGSKILHMYNFIREIHGISSVAIQDDLAYYSGTVNYEFAWAYGAFGYGHSSQLRNTKNPVFDSVCHSMFPRIGPKPDDLIDNKFRARVPQRLRMITLHSLMVRVPVLDKDERMQSKMLKDEVSKSDQKKKKRSSVQQDKLPEEKRKKNKPDFNKEAKTLIFRRVKYARGRPVHVVLNLDIHQKFMEGDFNHLYGEYICLRDRRERLEFLTRVGEGRLRDRYEIDWTTGLFEPMDDVKEARTVLSTRKPLACPPGYIEHVAQPCIRRHKGPPKEQEEGKDEILKGLPPAPRYSGYLAQVFGYAPKSKLPVEQVDFHVKPNAHLGGGEDPVAIMGWCTWICYKLKMFFIWFILNFKSFWEYLFPSTSLRFEMDLPEISVTLPTPADSTTEFYTHCTQEKVFPKVEHLTRAKREAIALVRMARRKFIEDDEEESDEEGSEKWNYQKEYNELLNQQRKISGQFMNAVGKDVRKSKDTRPMDHVARTKFGTQHVRPESNQVYKW